MGEELIKEKQCRKHNRPYRHICLDEECQQYFLLCAVCNSNSSHKHSKTTIEVIKQVRDKLSSKWDGSDSQKNVEKYFKKVREFYDRMRKDVIDLLNGDQKIVESLLEKISLNHLPIEASSMVFSEFKKEHYERLDKASILKLISEAEYGELNTNLQQQRQVLNVLDVELSKEKQKLATLEYVLLSKKMKVELLIPHIQQPSKISTQEEFGKIYGLFNSKDLLIRAAKMLYRATDNDFAPKKFYNCCNNQMNCLALIELSNGRKAGGFSPLPLVHHDEDSEIPQDQIRWQEDRSHRSFVFSLTNLASYDLKDSKKALGYKKNACGPIFGPDLDLSTRSAESSLGNSYQSAKGVAVDSLEARVYLIGAGKTPVVEMQIWQLSF